jgi:hypothetical protein
MTRDHGRWGEHERAGGRSREAAEVDLEDLSAPLRDDGSAGEVEDRDRDLAVRAHDRVLGGVERLSSCLPDGDPARVGELVAEIWIEVHVERERAGQILIHRQVDRDDDVGVAGDRGGILHGQDVALCPARGR